MNITTMLFDLDGTLLPMDRDVFVKTYFKGIAAKLAPYGYEPKELIDAIWHGTMKMIKNDGRHTNEEVFWDYFASRYGEKARKDLPLFDAFYRENFDDVQSVCGFNPDAAALISELKTMGMRVVLATNPIFPAIATQKRIRWAGLDPEDFELYTTYENSNHSKPNPAYYADILSRLSVHPKECLMVGNDVEDDMVAATLGTKVFLLTDFLINKDNKDISAYPNGGFGELKQYIHKGH